MEKNLLKRVKMLFESVSDETTTEDNFKDIKSEDGRIFRIEGDSITTDITIQEVTEDGLIDLEDGTYKLAEEDGKILTITVASGKITEVAEEEVVDVEVTEDVTEDMKKTVFKAIAKFEYNAEKFAIIKQIYKYDMEVDQEDFTIGTKVTCSYEYEGETTVYTAYAGTYELEDGRMITLNDEGIVVLITDKDGTVIEAPAVGDNPETGSTSTAELESTLSKVLDAFEKLQKDNEKLSKDFEEFKKAPSGKHTNLKIDFNEEENTLKRKLTPLDKLMGKK